MKAANTDKNGFSLVELLITIAIIAVLIALLLPAMRNAREQSKSIQCLDNLRELGLAAQGYIEQWNGSFPISQCPMNGSAFPNEWDFTEELVNGKTIEVPGILWQGATNLYVMQCPDIDIPVGVVNSPYTGYNYNTSYIGGGAGEYTPLGKPHFAPAKFGSLRNPSATALFGDSGSYSNKYMRSPVLMSGTNIGDDVSGGTRLAGDQGYRHLGRTNVCYCDGHCESLLNCYPYAGKNVGGTVTYYTTAPANSGTGFLSQDNSAYYTSPP
jgi:prepilin-type N-terminal cleavage/methylation domain-containing protein/prepilin-type processing-associated H-X9-DG protein